ncbi:SGNH/GDSL hydrolase family protein [Williamsoniiplasma lucivorax]|uniref:Lipolytic enzyme, GDSL family n=1 Tax=Williamsoniiplasma lucivorax TaxID=209274 RepID=A0A2S5RFN3_9MOLU|nr:SGNH/GDSL hydrolase family protein [Williamsoniiplasma lucivorax]PPE06146.1 lipolytic enzyme, GDSL family [Williamsoniiplasma lucivorax]
MKKLLSWLTPILFVLPVVATTVACFQKTPINPHENPLYIGRNINKSNAIDSSKQTTSGFTNYFVVGDSLSDVDGLGTLANDKFGSDLLEITVKTGGVGYGDNNQADKNGHNAFTNGVTAGYLLTEKLGFEEFEMKPSNIYTKEPKHAADFQRTKMIYGKNYAVGGATAGKLAFPTSLLLNEATIDVQTKALLQQHQIKDQDLVFMEIGGNDLFSLIGFEPGDDEHRDKFMQDAINRIRIALFNLLNNGVKHIIFMTPPSMNFVPRYGQHFDDNFKPIQGDTEALRILEICQKFYQGIMQVLNQVKQYYPDVVKLFDLFQDAVMRELQNDFKATRPESEQTKVNFKESFSKDASFEIKIDGQALALSGMNWQSLVTDQDAQRAFIATRQQTSQIKLEVTIKANENPNHAGQNIDNYFFTDFVHPTKGVHQMFADKLFEIAKGIKK